MKRTRIIAVILLAMSLMISHAAAEEITQTQSYGDGYSEISYYTTLDDKQEGNAFKVEYFKGDALQSTRTFESVEDGTLRTEERDSAGELLSYSLYKVEDGTETTRQYDAKDLLLTESIFAGKTTTYIFYDYDEEGKTTGKRVVTSSNEDVIRFDDIDADGNLLGYTLEANGRKDVYMPDGKLVEFFLYQSMEDETYVEKQFDSRGELIKYNVRQYLDDGSIRAEDFDAADTLLGYSVMTVDDDNSSVTKYFDAQGELLKTQGSGEPAYD
ncbi:MAG: hypothetical protein PHQ85_06740 [Eubacteriales bacterium]|jgi:hypothetical protein|nr:hypothetical protein [Eubacteriales bacterium]MDD4105764.1 hypothetical protein [Eubacteriales bacterium]MDD4710270.1 hypothetical protein [Eubacteriales bacterium]NLO14967.1 hypothetical protein [Clostridiales bacterium]